MGTPRRQYDYAEVEHMDVEEIAEELRVMEQDASLNTGPGYSSNAALYPDNQIPFTDKHLAYLKSHPKVNPAHYLSNLRLMIRIR